MATFRAAGLDGCRAGWLVAATGSGGGCAVWVAPSLEAAWPWLRDCACVLLDMPIGLPDAGEASRACDRLARRMLPPGAGPSVFPAPSRAALQARTHAEACALSRAAGGKGLSIQCWNILAKIREADAFLRGRPKARGLVRESHPEVVFSALAGPQVQLVPKKRAAGLAARLELIARHWPEAARACTAASEHYPRKAAAPDDILDALALCAVAREPGKLAVLGGDRDAAGLPRAIVYPSL